MEVVQLVEYTTPVAGTFVVTGEQVVGGLADCVVQDEVVPQE